MTDTEGFDDHDYTLPFSAAQSTCISAPPRGVLQAPSIGLDCLMLSGETSVSWLTLQSQEEWDTEIETRCMDRRRERVWGAKPEVPISAAADNKIDDDEGLNAHRAIPTRLPSELLADKWRPKAYTELLSDEKCNLEVMSYFQSFIKPPGTEGAAFVAPPQQILLLVGPPGVGKSTVANVIARHWGYDVVEVNASSERNVTALQKSLLEATANVKGVQPRCVVIEEIDGITPAAVKQLLLDDRFLRRSQRPIVCVANDLYSTALRPMRQHATVKVVPFPNVSEKRLGQRLNELVKAEQLWEAMPAALREMQLRRVAAMCEGDIRRGLNVLQFALIRDDDTDGVQPHNIFSVWRYVLTPPPKGQTRRSFYSQVRRVGDLGSILSGIHENYLTALPPGDFYYTNGAAIQRCCEWFRLHDMCRGSEMDAHVLAAVHDSVSRGIGASIQWPKRVSEAMQLREQRCAAAMEFSHSNVRTFHTLQSVTSTSMEYASALCSVIRNLARTMPNVSTAVQLGNVQRWRLQAISDLLRHYHVNVPTSSTDVTPSLVPYNVMSQHAHRLSREMLILKRPGKRDRKDAADEAPPKDPAAAVGPKAPPTLPDHVLYAGLPAASMPKKPPPKVKEVKDIFGRVVPQKTVRSATPTNSTDGGGVGAPPQHPPVPIKKVKFKYVTATTSTVRRNAKMCDFLK
eukprot:PhM_4_TR3229/c0_g1_i1/m.44958/K11269/CTF18, CHL12; chromosome transmission fidelity protein 18